MPAPPPMFPMQPQDARNWPPGYEDRFRISDIPEALSNLSFEDVLNAVAETPGNIIDAFKNSPFNPWGVDSMDPEWKSFYETGMQQEAKPAGGELSPEELQALLSGGPGGSAAYGDIRAQLDKLMGGAPGVTSVNLGKPPEYMPPAHMGMTPRMDLTASNEAFAAARPHSTVDDNKWGDVASGLAAGLGNLPRNASVAEILSNAGAGALAGWGQHQARVRDDQREIDQAESEYQAQLAQRELQLAQIEQEAAYRDIQAEYLNKTADRDTMQAYQEQMAPKATVSGGNLIIQETGPNGTTLTINPMAAKQQYDYNLARMALSAGTKSGSKDDPESIYQLLTGTPLEGNSPVEKFMDLAAKSAAYKWDDELLGELKPGMLEAAGAQAEEQAGSLGVADPEDKSKLAYGIYINNLAAKIISTPEIARALLARTGAPISSGEQAP